MAFLFAVFGGAFIFVLGYQAGMTAERRVWKALQRGVTHESRLQD